MSLSYFMPTVWSETLYRQLDREYVAVKNCSREFEGSIKSMGDTVKIVGISPITVFDYEKNSDMEPPAELSDTERMLVINRAKAFNFAVDDVDRAQALPGLMKEAMRLAASALANEADKYVFSLHSAIPSSNVKNVTDLDSDGVVDMLLSVRQKLLEQDVPGNEEIILEVSPAVASKIIKAKIVTDTNNSETLDKGCIGSFLGFRIYVSNNVATAQSGTSTVYKCFARTKRAIAFAEQLNEIEAYRPELRFADAVKGLHLYGAKIVYPQQIMLLNVSVA